MVYCVECPQYSIRLEALGYLCASCLLRAFAAAWNPRSSVTWLSSRSSVHHCLGGRVTDKYYVYVPCGAVNRRPTSQNIWGRFLVRSVQARAYSAQTVRSPLKLTYKSTSLGCLLAPEMIPIAHNCAIWAAALSQTPHPRVPYFVLFFSDFENSLRRNWKIFHWCMYVQSDSRLFFKNGGNQCRITAERPRCLDNKKNKTPFGTLEQNPCGDFAHFSYVSAHRAPSLIFQISST